LNNGKTNLPNLQNIIHFNMKGAIKIEPDDFDFTSIPEECILTDLNNTETEQDVHPYLRLKTKLGIKNTTEKFTQICFHSQNVIRLFIVKLWI